MQGGRQTPWPVRGGAGGSWVQAVAVMRRVGTFRGSLESTLIPSSPAYTPSKYICQG